MESRIPPLLVAVLLGLLVWLGARNLPGTLELAIEWRIGLALVLLLGGVFTCVAGVISFRRAFTTVNPLRPEKASALVCSGIYRYTRNPMYLGFAAFLLGWSIFLAWLPALLSVLGFVAYMNFFQIKPEERALEGIFGSKFTQYCSQVRRWL